MLYDTFSFAIRAVLLYIHTVFWLRSRGDQIRWRAVGEPEGKEEFWDTPAVTTISAWKISSVLSSTAKSTMENFMLLLGSDSLWEVSRYKYSACMTLQLVVLEKTRRCGGAIDHVPLIPLASSTGTQEAVLGRNRLSPQVYLDR